jgi:hypothetical protein
MPQLECLIVRQPYASLIASGYKRWEFRSYDTKKDGTIGIAASNTDPLRTKNNDLNRIIHLLPRGVVLATAKLATSFFVTSEDLKQFIGEPKKVVLSGNEIMTLGEPLGEPIEDVTAAVKNTQWQSFCWLLEDVKPLSKSIPFERDSQSTFTRARKACRDSKEEKSAQSHGRGTSLNL